MHNNCNKQRDEELMTDLQFLEYKRLSDELAEARQEIEMLRGNQNASDFDGMTDYQFKYIMGLKDENAALKKELETLRAEKATGNADK